MRTLRVLAVSVVLIVSAACGGGGSDGGGGGGGGGGGLLAAVKERGELRVSTDPAYKPQSFLTEDGTWKGFDIDVATEIAERLGVDVRFTTLIDVDPAPMAGAMVEAITGAVAAIGRTYRRMVSGAGHDAQVIARRFPAGMIFVPSRAGRSHTPAEYTAPDQAARGVEALAATLHRLAY